MANTFLQKNTVTATDAKKFTYSGWLKRTGGVNTSSAGDRFYIGYLDGNNRTYFTFAGGDSLFMYNKTGGTEQLNWESTRKFRDVNSWYHIVFSADSTQASQGDRFKVYVNGVEETSFTKTASPGQNFNWGNQLAQSNNTLRISGGEAGSNFFDGIMSHIHFIDGIAYPASTFGETDATTGEWKIKTSPTISNYGNNGFFILKDGNSVTDQSGKGNNFTVGGGTLTKTEDNPSNVFATLNPLVNNYGEMMALTQGNLTCESTTSSPAWKTAVSTLGITSGKYYWEVKFVNVHNAYNTGVMGSNVLSANAQNPMNQNGWTGFYNYDGGEIRTDGNLTTNDYGTYSTNDIMGVACDMDNYTITFYKNGVAHVSNASLSTTGRDVVFPASCHYQTNGGAQATYNFGNGYFGTTAVSSAGTNASNNGIFEYDVPTGFTALSTKGLNT